MLVHRHQGSSWPTAIGGGTLAFEMIMCNQVQSSAIKCNQVQSSAIKCNQVQSPDSAPNWESMLTSAPKWKPSALGGSGRSSHRTLGSSSDM